ncbi:MAG: 4Fe-4S dicluster domain-containing protein [Deltaproteobacteria bacterium]|nr:4Fe-4S dicluster domain-containing protein [Deltaproteobacteria bacterium]
MKANYGYRDGSGDYFIEIDTDLCDGCADCVAACPASIFEVGEDENDPLSDDEVASVKADGRKSLEYDCGPCKPVRDRPELPCVASCKPGAISHSW